MGVFEEDDASGCGTDGEGLGGGGVDGGPGDGAVGACGGRVEVACADEAFVETAEGRVDGGGGEEGLVVGAYYVG